MDNKDNKDNKKVKSRMIIMLICFALVFGAIFLYKFIGKYLSFRAMMSQSQLVTVSTMPVNYSNWQPTLTATGNVRAIKGVSVTTELAGMVQTIYFTPGAFVNQGTLLVQLNADTDNALLHSLEASRDLAQITYNRDKLQFAAHAVSKQTVDTDAANLKNFQAQVDQQAATVIKKTIRAPFTGRLGISAVNPGQYLNPGDKIVTLQTMDPIYVDFYVPQQSLSQLHAGLPVVVTSNAFPAEKFVGKITTIDSLIDSSTRNVETEATVANPKMLLTPGMFSNVKVNVGNQKKYLTLPQTAVSYNPYGEIVYVVKKTTGKDNQPVLTANQVFVTTGTTRADQVTILKGLKQGDVVVTSGQLKLKNGTQVKINNSVVPTNSATPTVTED